MSKEVTGKGKKTDRAKRPKPDTIEETDDHSGHVHQLMVEIKTIDAHAELWDALAKLAEMTTSIELNTLFTAESCNGAPQTQTFDHIQDAKRDMYGLNSIDES